MTTRRELYEAQADRARDELLRTLTELERRRGRVVEHLPELLGEHRTALIGAAGAGTALLVLGLGARAWLRRRELALVQPSRQRLLWEALKHPDDWVPLASTQRRKNQRVGQLFGLLTLGVAVLVGQKLWSAKPLPLERAWRPRLVS